jgi:hypothetical protein
MSKWLDFSLHKLFDPPTCPSTLGYMRGTSRRCGLAAVMASARRVSPQTFARHFNQSKQAAFVQANSHNHHGYQRVDSARRGSSGSRSARICQQSCYGCKFTIFAHARPYTHTLVARRHQHRGAWPLRTRRRCDRSAEGYSTVDQVLR